ncbi:MAG: hypothetical protein ABIJ23_04175 [Candidatus Magasanikbacteria bacterium]
MTNKSLKRTTILAIGLFVVVFLFLNLAPAMAQADVPGAYVNAPDTFGLEPVSDTLVLPGTDIRLIIARIIRAVLGLLGIMTLVIMMYAGFLIMTAGGNEEKVLQGKRTLVNATIGLVIILSSVAIVQFLLNMLSGQSQMGTPSDFVKKPYINTYSGSGALGTIVKDHYPMRDQTEVKRNTSIMVTFAEPVDPTSLILNSNNSCWDETGTTPTTTCDFEGSVPIYGDCLEDDYVDNFYKENCDRLVTSSVKIYKSNDQDEVLVEAAAMTTYDSQGNATTFVFKPLEPIGSDIDDVWYSVDLRGKILKKVPAGDTDISVFSSSFSGHYLWEFQTDTNFDFEPPYVTMARPLFADLKIPRNRVIQITFSEAMNPLTVQGVFGTSTPFDNIIINREKPTKETEVVPGEWKITNGYRTVQFISNEECGYNSCGEMMYCLPIDCNVNDLECSNPYRVLLRTALLLPNGVGFASYPLTGVADTADNGLDGNNDSSAQDRPPRGKMSVDDGSVDTKFIGIGEDPELVEVVDNVAVPDDYYWRFSVRNIIDREAPFIEAVLPNLDQGAVSEKAEVKINFSKVMLLSTMDYLKIVEHPDDSLDELGNKIEKEARNYYPIGSCFSVGNGGDEDKRCLDNIWEWDISDISEEKTQTRLLHRDFGPNGYDFYYFPKVPSEVTDENQNCLYPGYGPDADSSGEAPVCSIEYDDVGNIIEGSITNCVPVTFVSSTDTGCIQTTEGSSYKLQPDTATCIDFLKEASVVVEPTGNSTPSN